jgi:hypothetical protein
MAPGTDPDGTTARNPRAGGPAENPLSASPPRACKRRSMAGSPGATGGTSADALRKIGAVLKPRCEQVVSLRYDLSTPLTSLTCGSAEKSSERRSKTAQCSNRTREIDGGRIDRRAIVAGAMYWGLRRQDEFRVQSAYKRTSFRGEFSPQTLSIQRESDELHARRSANQTTGGLADRKVILTNL